MFGLAILFAILSLIFRYSRLLRPPWRGRRPRFCCWVFLGPVCGVTTRWSVAPARAATLDSSNGPPGCQSQPTTSHDDLPPHPTVIRPGLRTIIQGVQT